MIASQLQQQQISGDELNRLEVAEKKQEPQSERATTKVARTDTAESEEEE